MDRDEALKLLKSGEEGIREWNQRRRADEAIPDLSGADLRRAYLSGADLSSANLRRAILNTADLSGAILSGADLVRADLFGADLSGADLGHASLNTADLHHAILNTADLSGANLSHADLRHADLRHAILSGADLSGANLSHAKLSDADFNGGSCWGTFFANVDLSEVKGLESIKHRGPSTIGTDTLLLSKGKIPGPLLRGCGLTPWEVLSANLHSPELTPAGLVELQYRIFDAWTKGRSMINGCFVSYSWKDAKFVDKLRDRLMSEGINVWLDRHDMVAGTIQDQVWRAIQVHHVVIIVLSKDSVESDWVENELDMARQREKAERRVVLCPIALDDAWKLKIAAKGTPGDPSRPLWRTLPQKLVVDFHGWKTKAFDGAFEKLVRGLKVNYGPGDPHGTT